MDIIKYKSTIGERKDIESAMAKIEDQEATIEYMSMMLDVDIGGPEEDPEIGG